MNTDNQVLPTHKDVEEDDQLVEDGDKLPPINRKKAAGGASKWDDGEGDGLQTKELPQKQFKHKDKAFDDIVKGSDAARKQEIEELKDKARKEEREELENLMSKAQPAIPQGWDYLVLPRKINLLRVKTPPTIMQDDYFKPVKALVSSSLISL